MLTATQIGGFIGAGLAGAAYAPQISHLIRTRCSAGISRLAFGLWLLASSLVTPRAIAIHATGDMRTAKAVTGLAAPPLLSHHRFDGIRDKALRNVRRETEHAAAAACGIGAVGQLSARPFGSAADSLQCRVRVDGGAGPGMDLEVQVRPG